jgi:hypothetical protein
LYRSPNIVRMIKSRRLRWPGQVARMEKDRSAFKMNREKYPTRERPLGSLGNRILRREFGPKRDENGEWRRLHNEEPEWRKVEMLSKF